MFNVQLTKQFRSRHPLPFDKQNAKGERLQLDSKLTFSAVPLDAGRLKSLFLCTLLLNGICHPCAQGQTSPPTHLRGWLRRDDISVLFTFSYRSLFPLRETFSRQKWKV